MNKIIVDADKRKLRLKNELLHEKFINQISDHTIPSKLFYNEGKSSVVLKVFF